jgi:hypothetical protein
MGEPVYTAGHPRGTVASLQAEAIEVPMGVAASGRYGH